MTRALRIAFLTLFTLILMRSSFGQISITVAFPPPALPIYELPPCPAAGYLWVPGYWAWDPDYGYYWVPEHGSLRLSRDFYGRRAGGAGKVAVSCSTKASGLVKSDFMAASTMASATSAQVSSAAAGREEDFSITPLSSM